MMRAGLLFVCLVVLSLGLQGLAARVPDGLPLVVTKNIKAALKDFTDGDDKQIKNHWALLVAGSMGWGNYRHQADICHAYQVLKAGGLDDNHIVVMMYDDIADHPENMYPGEIYNKPGGHNVYKGVPKDYVRHHVNAATMLSVLLGDEEAVKGKGSGKVIKSGPSDRVFVVYSDHGAPGVLGMPSGPFLYADQLRGAISKKAAGGGFKEMVLYIEACESGSIFDGMLQDGAHVYATTASNPYESSWGTYCPGMIPSPPPSITTCLGDLYSVAWMENADEADLAAETLHRQYKVVRRRTANNFTYTEGSHVMQYGDLHMDGELAGDYMGMNNSGPTRLSPKELEKREVPLQGSVPQRDAELLSLSVRVEREKDAAKRARLQAELDAEKSRRARADSAAQASAVVLLQRPEVLRAVAEHMGRDAEELRGVVAAAVGSGRVAELEVAGEVEAAGEEGMGVFTWWEQERKRRVEGGKASKEGQGYWNWRWAWHTLKRHLGKGAEGGQGREPGHGHGHRHEFGPGHGHRHGHGHGHDHPDHPPHDHPHGRDHPDHPPHDHPDHPHGHDHPDHPPHDHPDHPHGHDHPDHPPHDHPDHPHGHDHPHHPSHDHPDHHDHPHGHGHKHEHDEEEEHEGRVGGRKLQAQAATAGQAHAGKAATAQLLATTNGAVGQKAAAQMEAAAAKGAVGPKVAAAAGQKVVGLAQPPNAAVVLPKASGAAAAAAGKLPVVLPKAHDKDEEEEHDEEGDHDDDSHDGDREDEQRSRDGEGKEDDEEKEDEEQQEAGTAVAGIQEVVQALLRSPLPPPGGKLIAGPRGRPLVSDWGCLRAMVRTWEVVCRPMDGYSMQYTRFLANLCNLQLPPKELARAMARVDCK